MTAAAASPSQSNGDHALRGGGGGSVGDGRRI